MQSGLLSICSKILNSIIFGDFRWVAFCYYSSVLLHTHAHPPFQFFVFKSNTRHDCTKRISHTQYITECYYNIVHIYYNKHFVNDIMSINCSRQFHECSEHKLNGNSLFINNLQEMVQHNMWKHSIAYYSGTSENGLPLLQKPPQCGQESAVPNYSLYYSVCT